MRSDLGEDAVFPAPDGAELVIRELRESDEAAIGDFLRHTDADDVRLRFFVSIRTFDHDFLWPLVHYDREVGVAYVALDQTGGDVSGVARLHCDDAKTFGEFAVLVRSDRHRHGLGHVLMHRIIDWARNHAVPVVRGEVLTENRPMQDLCRDLGFRRHSSRDDPGLTIAELVLAGP